MSPLRKDLALRAHEIINDPACWTPSAAARDHQHRTVSPRSSDATTFCGLGALTRAAHERGLSDRWLIDIFDASTLTKVVRANDDGHSAVLACLKQLGTQSATSDPRQLRRSRNA